MKLARSVFILALVIFSATSVALADDSGPQPQPTSAPAPEPTSAPPVSDQPPPNSSPVRPTQEQGGQSRSSQPSGAPGTSPGSGSNAPGTARRSGSANPSPGAGQSNASNTSTDQSAAPPAATDNGPSSNPDRNIVGSVAHPTGYSGPAQLTCDSSRKPKSYPFLVAPYRGWTELASYLDHDSPDYSVDGTIIITNGLTATSSEGQSSDMFPAYWSPELRQYINYDGHNGYDLDISYQPVLAAGSGRVMYAGWNDSDEFSGYGLMVLIKHQNGYVTLYGHLSELKVRQGQRVRAGQEIAISGNTGRSSGPHLHFSVFHNCDVTDPYGWTGTTKDPLALGGGETASYLWVKGREPLIVNPPPRWPSYPSYLPVTSPYQQLARSIGRPGGPPPVNRLLLLTLPPQNGRSSVGLGVALARTEAVITQESQVLNPYLNELRAEGLLDDYRAVPAAAAVWTRGTASAQQLEGLPGVASLAGVRKKDMRAAETGLAHAVLIQTGPQRAPSLWPTGFRSDLESWQPITSVSVGHALVAGFSLPGRSVVLHLLSGHRLMGWSRTTADPQNGGFVTTIHDRSGNPVSALPGDSIEFSSGGRLANMAVRRFYLKATTHIVLGQAPAGTSVPIAVTTTAGGTVSKRVAPATSDGKFLLRSLRPSAAGTLVVASIVDAAGNEESTSGFVPGLEVTVGSSRIRGWTGSRSNLSLIRNRRVISSLRLWPAGDGSFQTALWTRAGGQATLDPGDVIKLQSGRHSHVLKIPLLSLSLLLRQNAVMVHGLANGELKLNLRRASGASSNEVVQLGGGGKSLVDVSGAPLAVGDRASLSLVTRAGDLLRARTEARGIIVHEGQTQLTGRVTPGASLSAHLLDAQGRQLGASVLNGDARGHVHSLMADRFGRAIALQPGNKLVIWDETGSTTTTIPRISLELRRAERKLSVRAPSGSTVLLKGTSYVRPLPMGRHTDLVVGLGSKTDLAKLRRITVVSALGHGLTAERAMSLHQAARKGRPDRRHR